MGEDRDRIISLLESFGELCGDKKNEKKRASSSFLTKSRRL